LIHQLLFLKTKFTTPNQKDIYANITSKEIKIRRYRRAIFVLAGLQSAQPTHRIPSERI